MTLKVTETRSIHCDLCQYGRALRPGETPPKTCPACGDGESYGWSANAEKSQQQRDQEIERGERLEL